MPRMPGGDEAPDIDQPNKGARFKLQGHTASAYGSEPNMKAKGEAGKEPRDLVP